MHLTLEFIFYVLHVTQLLLDSSTETVSPHNLYDRSDKHLEMLIKSIKSTSKSLLEKSVIYKSILLS
jgi:hypothetical protein